MRFVSGTAYSATALANVVRHADLVGKLENSGWRVAYMQDR